MSDDALLDAIMNDMNECLEAQQENQRTEELRLRESTDPSKHLCGPTCPYLQEIESHRETVNYVCRISNLSWGGNLKWDAALASKNSKTEQPSGWFQKRSSIIGIDEDYPIAQSTTTNISTDTSADTSYSSKSIGKSTCKPTNTATRAAPRAIRENNLIETHYALRSMAEHCINTTLRRMQPEYRSDAQIRQDLLSSHDNDRAQHVRPFTLVQLNDILIEAQRRSIQSQQRMQLFKHVSSKSELVEKFVNLLAQLFSTLWIIINRDQIRRRELDSFKAFVQSLLNCLHRGMRISNQPILPRGILFFHETKRKYRTDSAHHALQQVQQVLGDLDMSGKFEQFQQCIRLSKELECLHQELIRS